MKTILSATAAFVLLATAALADEVPPPQPKIQQVGDSAKPAEDCSKQVWPHFSQACLRSEGKGTSVRLVTTERR
ncbi:hypothetical protein JQ582_37085 [Bradyrhizobium japonicum]|uniref:hypothetical protein n=1 Tax=Bradyrhizobium TaxID=374 RepID=UPI001BA9DA2D|nr:hypothetical protein [Bradyrhizobium japonicum]MBR0749553.1 hypothetical protein [Bradyrhizobium japonicum]MBR0808422.1 hypothetical protein [Bradyrhizobium japonicum]